MMRSFTQRLALAVASVGFLFVSLGSPAAQAQCQAAATWIEFGDGFRNGGPGDTTPTVTISNSPELGATIDLIVQNPGSGGNAACILFSDRVGAESSPFGGTIHVDRFSAAAFDIALPLAAGESRFSLTLPSDAKRCGQSIFIQVLLIDAGAASGVAFSNGLELILGDPPRIFGSDLGGALFVADASQAQARLVGYMGVVMWDIAATRDGSVIYGVTSGGSLYTIDPATAQATFLVNLSIAGPFNGLEIDAAGTLWASGSRALATIDPSTGQTTIVSDLGGRVSAGDIAFGNDGSLLVTTTSRELLAIDPQTYQVTVRGQIDGDVYGLAWARDLRLYGFRGNRHVVRIDESTGATEDLGLIQADFNPGGLAGATTVY